jgi:amidase
MVQSYEPTSRREKRERVMSEIVYWSAKALAEAIRTKTLSSLEVVDAHLRRIEEVNPKLNAVVQLTAEAAREQARQADAALARGEITGPVHGVPMTIKDSLSTKGVTTTAGTPGLRGFRPARDATAVERLRAAGAILLGKTNCAELCGSGETDNEVYGRTSNPYDLTRSPGGSSGGEVAIIAAGGSPLGLGSDSGGSIRGPCHLCGIAGLNPTMGRVSRAGHIPPYGGAFDTARVGPMARFVEDLSLVLRIVAGTDCIDPTITQMPLGDPEKVDPQTLCAAFYTDNGIFPVTPETVDTVKHAAQVLRDAGLWVEENRPDGIEKTMEISDGLQSGTKGMDQRQLFPGLDESTTVNPAALAQYAERWLQRAGEINETQSGSTTSAAEFLYWTMRWNCYQSAMLSFLKRFDVIICPVDAHPAMPHGFTRQQDYKPEGVTSYTRPYSLTGWPSAVVRGGTSPEGLPIGVQVVAHPWREDVALAVAQYIETSLGGWQRPPI